MKFAAPAKINLALHVTGQRPDGYHLIESLVVFADVGDGISTRASDSDRLTFSGPFGAALESDTGTNLVIMARDAIRAHAGSAHCPPVAIHLTKNLPLASGIGGGSADAAATLKGLNEHWQLGLTIDELCAIGLQLGADVPMCLHGKPLIAKGIGEIIEPLDGFPELHLLLVNPGVGVSTPEIFKALAKNDNEGLPLSPFLQRGAGRVRGGETRELKEIPPSSGAARHLLPTEVAGRSEVPAIVNFLRTTRNDLEAPARALCPAIGDVPDALYRSGAKFARMSGSGATCFGIFEDQDSKASAKAAIADAHPKWWIA
ncbi:MAG: 4-(cytidine 5'-diphospho)-2-C-methyl-D-erythritol kinase [Rhizobiaceae bacterium]